MAESNKNGVHGENNASFEQCFRRLQEVVQTLSEGNLTLEEALSSCEEGMRLADTCARMLDEAELRLERVSERVARAAAERVEAQKDQTLKPVGGAAGADEIIAMDITSFEERIVFSAPPDTPVPPSPTANLEYSPLPGERRGPRTPQPRPPPNGTKTNPPATGAESSGKGKGENLDLDPLFDEDD